MPPAEAMIRWVFKGGADGSELAKKRGNQRAYAGDPVTDEMLGDGNQHFFSEGETLEEARTQFEDMIVMIASSPGFSSLKYHDLWARMLVEFADEYPLALRLVAISLIVPADTSECERIFSLMNNIKTAERSTMGQKNLKNLMLWHELGKQLSPQELPVMAILKEFREMAGPGGRHAHHAAPQPTYAYEAHRIKPEGLAPPAPRPPAPQHEEQSRCLWG